MKIAPDSFRGFSGNFRRDQKENFALPTDERELPCEAVTIKEKIMT